MGNRGAECGISEKEEGIRLIAEDTGKNYGRTVSFYAGDGKMEVRTVRHETVVL